MLMALLFLGFLKLKSLGDLLLSRVWIFNGYKNDNLRIQENMRELTLELWCFVMLIIFFYARKFEAND